MSKIIIGRTLSGKLIRHRITHALLVGGSGSGKGIGIIIPNLLTYAGSCVVFDTKSELFKTCGAVRARMGRVIRLAPFGAGADSLNVLDLIQGGPLLIDQARAVAESLVPRKGTESDEHWLDRAVQTTTGILVFTLLCFSGEERSLNTLQEIASSPPLIAVAAEKLCQMKGIPARLGSQLKALFDADGVTFTKEGSGIASTVARSLAFLDSELVAASIGKSTFGLADLRGSGIVTVFLEIPPEMLESMRGLLRCWVATLIRMMGKSTEAEGEVLFLLDEASALGSLPALEEALVRGRGGGIRLLLVYQSDAQVKAAFPQKPGLIYDNCSCQIYLGASSYETAERISKMLGDATIVIESASTNSSRSGQSGGQGGTQVSHGSGRNLSEISRALLRPDEVLMLPSDYLIAFVKDVPAVMARRIRWFDDELFGTAKKRWKMHPLLGWVLFAISIGFIIAKIRGWKP